MIDETLLSYEEKAIYTLRSLYRKYGYLPYKMRKFEEYDLYMKNKDFLVSDRIITFHDTDGQLLALKPDVTLSIIKNGEDIPGYKQKVYYDEKVYRVSQSTHRYKEITQAGLECIGDIDLYDIFEAITLAAQSLSELGDKYILDVSHLGVLSEVLLQCCDKEQFAKDAVLCIAEKNTHDLKRLCEKFAVKDEMCDKLCTLVTARGTREEVLCVLQSFSYSGYEELAALSRLLDKTPFSDKIRFDFSVVNDMRYYTGVVFRGFIDGISCGVLAGGQYDRLMEKMGRTSGAVGFAVYLDMLEQIHAPQKQYDIDTLLLYDGDTDVARVAEQVQIQTAYGNSVSAQKCKDMPIRFREIKNMQKEG